jgi:hypothetical protein
MTSDERVVTSFVAEDEDLRGTWTATKVAYGKGQIPPMVSGEEVVAVTDERVLWFQDELEALPLDAIEGVDREYIERQAAPPMVLGGGLVFVLSIFASIGAFFANAGGPLVVAMPALTGLLVFVLAFVVARLTGREGQVTSGHRLRLWTEGGAVSIWAGEEEAVAGIEGAVEGDGPGSEDVGSESTASTDELDDEEPSSV